MAKWQVQEAKSRFSELIEEAATKGPQIITRHGAERAVLLSVKDYRSLVAHKPDLKQYLLGGPKVDEFEVKRGRDMGRKTALCAAKRNTCSTRMFSPRRARSRQNLA
jgi:antitoxin Phd